MGVDFVNSVDDAAEGVGTTRINMPNCGLLFLKNCLYSMTSICTIMQSIRDAYTFSHVQ